MRIGRFELHSDGRGVTLDGHPVEMSWRCHEALLALVEAHGEIVSRDAMFARLWPGVAVEDTSLTKVVTELRRTLAGGDPARKYVETVPGMGYRLAVPLQAAAAAPQMREPRWRWIMVGSLAAVGVLVLLSFGTGPPDSAAAGNPEADAVYRQGMELLNHQSWAPRQESKAYFQRAIEIDPGHARAHAALAFALMSSSRNHEVPLMAARKAVELDPDCGTCQATLGYALEVLEWDWSGSRKHLERAVELAPHDTRTRTWYAHNLAVNGEPGRALVEVEKAVGAAEYESGPRTTKAVVLYLMKRFRESVEAADSAIGLEYEATGAWEFRSKALFLLGEHKQAVGDIFRQWQPWERYGAETMARLNRDGYRAALSWFVEASSSGYRIGNNPYHRAWWFTRLGRLDEALTELEAGVELRPYNMVYVAVDPGFEPLRSEERFDRILQQLGRADQQTSLLGKTDP